MGIQCRFGTQVLGSKVHLRCGGIGRLEGFYGARPNIVEILEGVAGNAIGRGEYGHTSGVSGAAVRALDLRRCEITNCQLGSSIPLIADGSA